MITIERIDFHGWADSWRMSNGEVELVVTGDVGPRVMRYGFAGGQNFFKEFTAQLGKTGEADWQPRGGHRVWIAPEDPVKSYAPDNAPVAIHVQEGEIVCTGPVEALTGMEKTITVRMAAKGTAGGLVQQLGNAPAAVSPRGPPPCTRRTGGRPGRDGEDHQGQDGVQGTAGGIDPRGAQRGRRTILPGALDSDHDGAGRRGHPRVSAARYPPGNARTLQPAGDVGLHPSRRSTLAPLPQVPGAAPGSEQLQPAEVGHLQPPHLGRLPARGRAVREALRGSGRPGSSPRFRLHLRNLHQRGLPGTGDARPLDDARPRPERIAHRALVGPPRRAIERVDRRRTGRGGAAAGLVGSPVLRARRTYPYIGTEGALPHADAGLAHTAMGSSGGTRRSAGDGWGRRCDDAASPGVRPAAGPSLSTACATLAVPPRDSGNPGDADAAGTRGRSQGAHAGGGARTGGLRRIAEGERAEPVPRQDSPATAFAEASASG